MICSVQGNVSLHLFEALHPVGCVTLPCCDKQLQLCLLCMQSSCVQCLALQGVSGLLNVLCRRGQCALQAARAGCLHASQGPALSALPGRVGRLCPNVSQSHHSAPTLLASSLCELSERDGSDWLDLSRCVVFLWDNFLNAVSFATKSALKIHFKCAMGNLLLSVKHQK